MEKPRLLQGYVNADYAGDLDQRRSMMGYVFTVAECVSSWKAELQDTVTLSTTEVEYMTVVEASKKALWLRGLVKIFCIILSSGSLRQSAIHFTKNHMYHKRMKHIDVGYHKIRELVIDEKALT